MVHTALLLSCWKHLGVPQYSSLVCSIHTCQGGWVGSRNLAELLQSRSHGERIDVRALVPTS